MKLIASALVVSVLMLVGVIGYRAHSVDSEAHQLCSVVYGSIARSGAALGKSGSPGYAYYQEHPDELKLARAQNIAFLEDLPCKIDRSEWERPRDRR